MNLMVTWVVLHGVVEHQINVSSEMIFARVEVWLKILPDGVQSNRSPNEQMVLGSDLVGDFCLEQVALSGRTNIQAERNTLTDRNSSSTDFCERMYWMIELACDCQLFGFSESMAVNLKKNEVEMLDRSFDDRIANFLDLSSSFSAALLGAERVLIDRRVIGAEVIVWLGLLVSCLTCSTFWWQSREEDNESISVSSLLIESLGRFFTLALLIGALLFVDEFFGEK